MELIDKKKRSLKGISRFEENPFIEQMYFTEGLEPKTKPLYGTKETWDEEGTVHEISVIKDTEYYWKDVRTYTKLFQNVKDNNTMVSMGSSGLKLFLYIVNHLKKDKDYIVVSFEQFSLYTNIKARTTFYDAIIELEKLNIIRLSAAQNMFYINPKIIFNGRVDTLLVEPKIEYGRRLKSKIC